MPVVENPAAGGPLTALQQDTRLQPQRPTTVTPSQALALMNNSFVLRQARLFADRVRRLASGSPGDQADWAVRLAFCRPATRGERNPLANLIRNHGLNHACWALLNSSEFLYSP